MSVARLLVLVAAAVAAVFVWLYVRNSSANVPAEAVPAAAPATTAVRVLVAAKDLGLGQRVAPADLAWREWPDAGVSPLFITDLDDPAAVENHAGFIVRDTIAEGEPIVARKLVAAGDAGFMAAILEPGHRAVATEINAETAAGGFILPGDRVDVIVSFEADSSGERGQMSRTILENVRVLAIDQTASRSDEEQVKVGATATLELTPPQAELLALAQGMGDITLSLRALADAAGGKGTSDGSTSDARRAFGQMRPETLTIYRYGSRTDAALEGAP
jgi:pilus assembly protein CpaB